MQYITIILSITASVVSGMALFFLQRFFKKKDSKDVQRDKEKAEQSILILKSINAVGKLTEANSIALRDGKTNGEMHSAMDEYSSVEKELYEFLLKQNSRRQ